MRVRRLAFVLVGVLALVAGACSGSTPQAAAPTTAAAPETTVTLPPTTPTTVRATTTSSTLKPTTTTSTMLGLGTGDASIGGTVSGPAGPVDGAIVRVERVVGKLVATTDITTSGGGLWQLGSILGGSYRVRALKPPDFGQSSVEAFFLAANERRIIDLKMPAAGVERITATVNPNPPRIDQQATVTVQMGTSRIDDQGRVVLVPRPGVVLLLTPAPGIFLDSNPQAVTDGNGSAAWVIRCAVEGAKALTLTVANAAATTINLPPCGAAPATTTTRPR